MKVLSLSMAVLLMCVSGYAQSWQPVVDMNTTGYSDSWNRTVVRTKNNVVYYVMNHSGISSGASQVRVYKGNATIPTAFAEMDAAHEPTDSTRIIGVDARLNDSTGIISIAYQLTSPLEARYITFDTNTDSFGSYETIATVNHAPALRYLSKVSLALDGNGVPHATFGGDNEGLYYSNRAGGTWSSKFTISTNLDDMHPSMVIGTDGVLHLAWLNFDSPRRILYRERTVGGNWSATETVDGAVGTVGDKVDQSPSIALSADNQPLILYHNQADSNGYVVIKRRDAANTYTDVSPTPGHTALGHDWAITVDWAGNWTICGHGNPNSTPIEPQCMTRTNSSGTWSALTTLISDGKTHDGSASLRYDPIWPGDQSHLDLAYFDENTPSDSFYMAATIGGPGGGGGTTPVTFSPSSLSFSNQTVGTSSTPQTITVTNSGQASLIITLIAAPGGFTETDNCLTTLIAGASCQISVTFTPNTTGAFSASMLVSDDAANSPQSVSLTGTGVAAGYSISGTISPTASGNGANVAVAGSSSATTVANSAGSYTFSGLADGNYVVTPSKSGQSFSPASRAVAVSGASVNGINFTGTAMASGQTIFTNQTPVLLGRSDGSSANYELGVAFRSNAPGNITAIRFWKDARETGLHTGHIWSASGQLLATAAFSGETASGWQQASLAAPVPIAANTTYVASVNTGATYYVDTLNGLAAQISNQNLSSIVGNNGLYGSAGQFPAGSYQHSNYFRDVVFSPSLTILNASGTISPGSTGAGTVLTLSGTSAASVTADSSGNYTFSGLANGSYTVTPVKTGVTFTPPSLLFTLNGFSATGLNFTAANPIPVLKIAPSTLSFAVTQGNSDPPPSSIVISNTGQGTLSYSVTSDQPWLSASPSTGTAPQGLTVNVTAQGLAAATYTGHLTITSNGAQGSPASATITLVVLPSTVTPAVLAVAPGAVNFTASQGGANPVSQTINVSNAGGGSLNFQAASDQTWLTVSPSSGTAPSALSVGATPGALAPGNYSGSITITAAGTQGSPAVVNATLTVTPASSPGTVLLGNQTVLGYRDQNPLGQAEAFQTTAIASGTLGSLSLYLDSSNSAKKVTIGLYTDSSGHPGTLLTQATTTTINNGAWNPLAVPSVSITSGVKYWIAILGTTSGSFRFRDSSRASCGNEGSAQTNLTSLPGTWTSGPVWGNCPVSGFGTATAN